MAAHAHTTADGGAVDLTVDVTVGVDVGGTSTRVVVVDGEGVPISASVSGTPQGAPRLVDHLVREIESAVEEVGGTLARVGVGIPGAVTPDGTVPLALNVGIETPTPLGPPLAGRLGVPVHFENDVNAAALGARHHLGVSSLAYLAVGTGFASGVVLGGAIVRGSTGGAGEIGHLALPGSDRPCPCGQVGCIETVVSGRAITERMVSVGLDGDVTDLWRAADAAHAAAVAIRDDAVAALAWSCQLVGLLLDVERIVIGGGVTAALGEALMEPIRATLTEPEAHSPFLAAAGFASRVSAAPTDVELGAIGADLAARDAVRNAADRTVGSS